MASGHVNRAKRPNIWAHRPMLQTCRKLLPTRSRPHMREDRKSSAVRRSATFEPQRTPAKPLDIENKRPTSAWAIRKICRVEPD